MTMEHSGHIHSTTLAQRAKSRPRDGVIAYEGPADLSELLKYGYISPDYNWAPTGMRFQTGRGIFKLIPHGG